MTINPATGQVVGTPSAASSPTRCAGPPGSTVFRSTEARGTPTITARNVNGAIVVNMAGANPLVPGAPNIEPVAHAESRSKWLLGKSRRGCVPERGGVRRRAKWGDDASHVLYVRRATHGAIPVPARSQHAADGWLLMRRGCICSGSLSNAQLNSVGNAIRRFEGWQPGTVRYRLP